MDLKVLDRLSLSGLPPMCVAPIIPVTRVSNDQDGWWVAIDGKNELTPATQRKFASFYPLDFFGLIHKQPGSDLVLVKNLFSH